jgi:hypothetical protein
MEEKRKEEWEKYFKEKERNPFENYPIAPSPFGGYCYYCPECLKTIWECACVLKKAKKIKRSTLSIVCLGLNKKIAKIEKKLKRWPMATFFYCLIFVEIFVILESVISQRGILMGKYIHLNTEKWAECKKCGNYFRKEEMEEGYCENCYFEILEDEIEELGMLEEGEEVKDKFKEDLKKAGATEGEARHLTGMLACFLTRFANETLGKKVNLKVRKKIAKLLRALAICYEKNYGTELPSPPAEVLQLLTPLQVMTQKKKKKLKED